MRKHESKVDYITLGEQTKQAREELFKILSMSKGLPNSITQHIVTSISKLDSFRCKAEDYMFAEDPEQSIHVFYGARQNTINWEEVQ